MAFYNDQDDEEQKNDGSQVASIGSPSSVITGDGEGVTQSQAQSGDQAGSPDNPSNFVGIKQYLDQNKQQSDKLAKNVGGYVESKGQQAQEAIGQSQQQYNQAVAQGTVQKNQQLIDQAKQDAASVASDEAKKAEFQKMRDAQYQGPETLQQSDFYQPVAQSLTEAQRAADNTQTVSGRNELLSSLQQSNTGKSSAGATMLDNALLGASSTAKDVFGQAREKVGALQGQLSAAEQEAVNKANAAKSETEAARQAVLDSFAGENSVQANLEKELVARSQSLINQSKQQADQTAAALKASAQLNDNQLKLLGITKQQYNELLADRDLLKNQFGKDPYSDLSIYAQKVDPTAKITAQNVATADEYAKYLALNDLMGTQGGFLTDPSLAGTADTDALAFDFANAKGNVVQSIEMERQAKAQREAEAAAAKARAEAEAEAKKKEMEMLGYIAAPSIAVPVAVVKSVGKAVGYKGRWCFALDTDIELEHGSIKASDIKVGDEIFLGGKVLEFEIKDTDPAIVKEYNGVHLTEDHKVLENKAMIAVKHSEKCKPASKNVNKVVYIVTEKHVVIANDTVFSDCFQHGEE